ncbi:MAG: aminotransferase class V-fold PLP-dependent enzyme [Spirochaetaceae bacterium]|jgi:cysteine desulfurase family protein|nr:aminotransferase class V-fold PLP-dependent enzyme [Spirochaetaceae bacterium]
MSSPKYAGVYIENLAEKVYIFNRLIYMNHASTSPRKSERVKDALTGLFTQDGILSAGRNFEGLEDGAVMLRARKALMKLFGFSSATNVILTGGVTISLNMILGGLLKPGDHALATHVEHNAVSRPLALLQKRGIIDVDFLPCGQDGSFDPRSIGKYIRPNTRLFIMTHASNVLGTILPAEECFTEAKRFGLFTVLDAAQTAGLLPLEMNKNIDVLAFTGHKGLGGLPGSGGFVLGRDAAAAIDPWITGGTGSASQSLEQPDFLPDKYESGTANIPGILSLAVAVEELLERGLSPIREQTKNLTRRFLDGIRGIPNLVVHGPGDAERSVAIVPVSSPGWDNALLAGRLFDEYGIITRCGLHCSPLAHQSAGTFPEGSLRFSFGYETTEGEIDAAVRALENLVGRAAGRRGGIQAGN